MQFAGNKAKGRISKRVLQKNKSRQIFRKTNISYPLIRMHVRIMGDAFLLMDAIPSSGSHYFN